MSLQINNKRTFCLACCIHSTGSITGHPILSFGNINGNYSVDIAFACFTDIFGFYNRAGCIGLIVLLRSIVIESLATLGKGNVAGLHSYGGSSKTFGNRYAACKVAVACHVPQLVCQRIQYFADIIFFCSGITVIKALADAVVAGIKHHLAACFSIENLYITADNSTRCSIIMLIPYLSDTFGIGNMNRIVIIYLNNTGRCLILAAYKAAHMRNTVIFFVIRPAVISKIACIKAILTGSIFINPLRAVLQPQIYFTGFCCTGIVNYTLPG